MDEKPKSRRRWLQISLRTLLILMTIVSGAFGWLGLKAKQAREQRFAVAKILELRGDVYYDYQHDFAKNYVVDRYARNATPPGPA